jgi:acyl-CoA dehydrogenase
MTAEDDRLLEQTLTKLFEEHSGPADRRRAETEGWAPECWASLVNSGLAWIGVPESAGGSGGDFLDARTLVRTAARHAVPLPLAECVLLGGWLVASAGLRLPDGPVSVPVPRAADTLTLTDGRVTGTLHRVPWGSRVTAIAAVAQSPDGDRVVLIEPAEAEIRPGRNVAGEPRDEVRLESVPIPAGRTGPATAGLREELTVRGALSRAILMAGAMDAVMTMTVAYSGQRHQFGRPIGSFQAVAQRLVRLASEAEAGYLAAEVAARHFAEAGTGAAFQVAMAKATACRTASEVITQSHQIHGAIGMTQEYALHDFTRRLLVWRQEWGAERHWAAVVGAELAARPGAALWPAITTDLVTR